MKSVTLKQAEKWAGLDYPNRKVTSLGFEERQLGPHVVNVYYYQVDYSGEFDFTEYRADVYVDGRQTHGISFR